MTPPQLLALDLDGTLIEPLHPLRPRVVKAVKAALAAGVRVTLSTGRMYVGAQPIALELEIEGPISCYQGAVIADVPSGRFEREVAVPNAIALRVYAAAKEHGYHVQFYRADRFYAEERNKYTDLYGRISGTEPIIVPSLPAAFAGSDSTKVNIVTEPERTPAAAELLRRVCGDDAYVTRSNPEFVEVLNRSVNKGATLQLIAAQLGIPLERVLAIGDSYNDLPLLRAAGFGVAMGSAPPELKAEADAVVGDVEADGVAEAIERYVLAAPGAERVAG
ncbi:MAG TPA: Cof-type HAD-IIB family hydrolase [Candidatus Baltobacteraceae bacterium]|nr:Cof-type HAD-IIB family hydrolase [Candidatus Baltobacteraceae bacterium]